MADDQDARQFVTSLADDHYGKSNEPIYLAGLGISLRNQGLWPIEGEKQSLKEWLKTLEPGVVLVQNPRSPARVAIATRDKADLIESTLLDLDHSHLLNTLVRSVLLAFVVPGEDEAPVFLHRQPPFKYTVVKPEDAEAYHEIEPKFRLPGLKLKAVSKMAPSDVAKLGSNIQRWAEAKQVKLDTLTKAAVESAATPIEEVAVGTMSALDRLLAAQRTDVRNALVIPADIAVLLSRHR